MTTFVTTVIAIVFVEAFAKVYWLAKGQVPPKTSSWVATEIVLGVALGVWGIMVLET